MSFNANDFLKGLWVILTSDWFVYVFLIAFVIAGYFVVHWLGTKEVDL